MKQTPLVARAAGGTSAAGTVPVLVIGGPTASGKSALALDAAQAFGGTVINADSMQVYAGLPVLTACPTPDALARVPHRLYGVLSPDVACSAARWRDMALAEIAEAAGQGRLPVVVGGTGLYLRALIEGLSEIPAVPDPVRAAARAHHAGLGGAAFHAGLAARDPEMAARLAPGDTQRLIRAWEVLEATGRSLADWQAAPAAGPPPGLRFVACVLDPPRALLYAACDGRFRAMVAAGALDEVAALDRMGLDPALPVMKALGVPELRAVLHGTLGLEEAVARAQQATRRYAKRQVTWFRNQLIGRAPAASVHGCHVVENIYDSAQRAAVIPMVSATLHGQ